MNNNVSSQASIVTTVQVWFTSIPLLTRSLLVLCVGLYLVQLLTGQDDLSFVCLAPAATVTQLQVWRIITSPLFHVGLLHVAFNMMAFVPCGSGLERLLGTLLLAHHVVLVMLLGGALYIGASWILAVLPIQLFRDPLLGCGVGLSGVVFGLIVLDTHHSGVSQRSIFGLFNVPARVYPWALLVNPVQGQGHTTGSMGGASAQQIPPWQAARAAAEARMAKQASGGRSVPGDSLGGGALGASHAAQTPPAQPRASQLGTRSSSQELSQASSGPEAALQSLLGMGFDEAVSRQALQRSGGNPSQAAEYLLSLNKQGQA
ncbi:hypothetical protein WJX84_008327 [Apatococcus fuscideae]|uniref:UBA domain-containing protein n=1 Tax=Apatococcus fuscideae TaxID=2026836 RepID=A0AAW1TI61_9CHLO